MGTGATACAKLMVDQLRDRNFILCFLGGYNEDYFAFVHRTFLEYFCAWEFVRQFDKPKTLDLDGLIEVFREHWRDESWHEVLRLMAGMLDAKFTGQILEYLIGENGEAEKFSNLFLAAQCVSEVRNRNSIDEIGCKLRDQVKELTRYNYTVNVRSFSDEEHNQLVKEIPRQAVAAVAATWKDDPETLPWLKQRAQSDDDLVVREAAVQEIARGWKDDPKTLPWLKQLAQSDDNWLVRGTAVQEIARGWKDHPETLPWLKQRAQSDDDPAVRFSAIQEIARGWKDHPETLPNLKQRAQSDDNPAVRLSALKELARGWKDDPETLHILKQRAQSDDNWLVRAAAVQELAGGWKDEPETLHILKQRAQSDDDLVVRLSALQEIARGWKDEPGIFELLCDVAINDRFEREHNWQGNPRQAALTAMIELYPDRPETLELLRDRAQNDSDDIFREFAQEILAELERLGAIYSIADRHFF
jgi:predicted NACHT family NTPase